MAPALEKTLEASLAGSQNTGKCGSHRQPLQQFDLHSILFWFMPYAAICFVVLTAFSQPTSSSGRGLPIDDGGDWSRSAWLRAVGHFGLGRPNGAAAKLD